MATNSRQASASSVRGNRKIRLARVSGTPRIKPPSSSIHDEGRQIFQSFSTESPNISRRWFDVPLPIRLAGLALLEQVGQQVVQFLWRELVNNVGWHRRKPGLSSLLNLTLGNSLLGPFAVDEHDHRPLLADDDPVGHPAVVQGQDRGAKGDVDIAVRIEHVLQQALNAAIARAIELWADAVALAGNLVTGRAVLLKN